MSEHLDFLANIMPSILAFSTAVITFYKNEKNQITFYMSILKVLIVSITLIYFIYLYFGKNQQKVESSVKIKLIQNTFTLIFAFSSVYFIYKELINKQVQNVATNVSEVTSSVATNMGISKSISSNK
jgi:hypothetical protein